MTGARRDRFEEESADRLDIPGELLVPALASGHGLIEAECPENSRWVYARESCLAPAHCAPRAPSLVSCLPLADGPR